MNTETINGVEYQIGKLGLFEQLHVGRKLAPMLAHALPALAQLSVEGEKPDLTMLVLSAAAVPIAEVMSRMTKEDFEYVILECLKVCQRKQTKGWAAVAINNAVMFSDIEADTVIALAQAVVNGSLGRFFPTSPAASPETETSTGSNP